MTCFVCSLPCQRCFLTLRIYFNRFWHKQSICFSMQAEENCRRKEKSVSSHINTPKKSKKRATDTEAAACRAFHNFGQNKSQLSLSAPKAAVQTGAAERGWGEGQEENPELFLDRFPQLRDPRVSPEPGPARPARSCSPPTPGWIFPCQLSNEGVGWEFSLPSLAGTRVSPRAPLPFLGAERSGGVAVREGAGQR